RRDGSLARVRSRETNRLQSPRSPCPPLPPLPAQRKTRLQSKQRTPPPRALPRRSSHARDGKMDSKRRSLLDPSPAGARDPLLIAFRAAHSLAPRQILRKSPHKLAQPPESPRPQHENR